MHALLLIGHGSLRRGSGAAMLRLAARLRERKTAPLVAAGFLNYSRPTMAEALERLISRGATSVTLLPYFLVPGYFTRVALPRALKGLQAGYPWLPLSLAEPFGAHPALAALVCKRAVACGANAHSALLLAAHGSPDPTANMPIHTLAGLIAAQAGFAAIQVCFLGLNIPDIPGAIATQIAVGRRHIVVVPYLLQLGGHAAEDLPAIVTEAQAQAPGATITLANHLGYDPLLADVLADRADAALREMQINPNLDIFDLLH